MRWNVIVGFKQRELLFEFLRTGALLHNAVSSGRQIPTSEQRGHLGLSTKGAGMVPFSASARAASNASRVLGHQRVINRKANPLLGGVVIEHGLVAAVAVVAQDQRLGAHLDAIGGPRLGSVVRLRGRPFL